MDAMVRLASEVLSPAGSDTEEPRTPRMCSVLTRQPEQAPELLSSSQMPVQDSPGEQDRLLVPLDAADWQAGSSRPRHPPTPPSHPPSPASPTATPSTPPLAEARVQVVPEADTASAREDVHRLIQADTASASSWEPASASSWEPIQPREDVQPLPSTTQEQVDVEPEFAAHSSLLRRELALMVRELVLSLEERSLTVKERAQILKELTLLKHHKAILLRAHFLKTHPAVATMSAHETEGVFRKLAVVSNLETMKRKSSDAFAAGSCEENEVLPRRRLNGSSVDAEITSQIDAARKREVELSAVLRSEFAESLQRSGGASSSSSSAAGEGPGSADALSTAARSSSDSLLPANDPAFVPRSSSASNLAEDDELA